MVAMPDLPTTKRRYTCLREYAEAHHSTVEAFVAAGWDDIIVIRKDRPSLRFRTASGERFRFIDGEKPTYDQDFGYQMCWYGLARAIAIAKKGGFEYIVDCNGAASTIPAQAKGLPAYSLQSGENAAPKQELLDELKAGWNNVIIVAMDCDKEGRESAIKRVRLYRKHGFDAVAVDLSLGIDGGDLADFIASHDNPFIALLACPRIEIPVIVEKPPKQITSTPDEQRDLAQKALDALSSWRRDTYSAWTEVGMSLSELGSDGLYLWESWSRSSEKFKEGQCDKKWRTFKPGAGIRIASLFAWADEDSGKTWRPAKAPPVKVAQLEVSPVWEWSQGLPFGVRAALNLYADDPIAPVLELWVEAINAGLCKPDEPVDIEFLNCVAELLERDISDKTIRRGVNLGAGQFLSNMSHNIYIYNYDSIDSIESYTGYIKSDKVDRNPSQCQTPLKAGRKAELYKLLPIPQIVANVARLAVTPILERAFPIKDGIIAPIRTEFLQELGCEPEQAEKVRAELISKYDAILRQQPNYSKALNAARFEYKRFQRSLTNPASYPIPKGMEYKAGCARALVDFHGGETQFARQALSNMIGCTFRNLNAVLKRAGVYMVKEQFCEQPIKSLAHLKGIRNQYNPDCKGFPSIVKSSRQSRKPSMQFKAGNPNLYKWGNSEIAAGAELTLLYRQANKQTTTKPIELVEDKPAPEPTQTKLNLPPTIHQRYMITIAQCVLLDWLAMVCVLKQELKAMQGDPEPEQSNPTYPEQWLQQLTEKVTPLQVKQREGETMFINTQTGEIEDYTAQKALEVLQANKPIGIEVKDDPLVDMLISLGGVVTQVYDTEIDDAGDHDLRGIFEPARNDQAQVR